MTEKQNKPGNEASDRSGGHPVPAPSGVDQHNEDPRDRAIRLGQGDVVNPAIPTGQNRDQMIDELIPHDSNEQLRIAGEKRGESTETEKRGAGADQRGQTTR